MAASITPVVLAAKSIQSPLLRPPVQYSCKSSIMPLISTGRKNAPIERRLMLIFFFVFVVIL